MPAGAKIGAFLVVLAAGALPLPSASAAPLFPLSPSVGKADLVVVQSTPREEALAKVRELVSEHMGVPVETLTGGTNLEKDLGADELDLLEMVMAMEEEFDIEISEERAAGIVTIGDAVDTILELSR